MAGNFVSHSVTDLYKQEYLGIDAHGPCRPRGWYFNKLDPKDTHILVFSKRQAEHQAKFIESIKTNGKLLFVSEPSMNDAHASEAEQEYIGNVMVIFEVNDV